MNDQHPGERPAWDGVPLDELPLRLIKGLDLLAILEGRRGFPAGAVLSQNLNRGAVSHIRGAKIEVDENGDTSVTLWIPAFEDQTTNAAEQAEPTDHLPFSETERLEIAELAFAALGAAMPDRVVHFGFLTANSSFALPWHEYCRHYPHPPEYALGYWEYESE